MKALAALYISLLSTTESFYFIDSRSRLAISRERIVSGGFYGLEAPGYAVRVRGWPGGVGIYVDDEVLVRGGKNKYPVFGWVEGSASYVMQQIRAKEGCSPVSAIKIHSIR